MKKLLLIILVLLYAVPSYAASVTLGWDYEDDSFLVGYKFYYQRQPNNILNPNTIYQKILPDPKARTVVIDGLLGGVTYKFWCTAYNDMGESGNSNEIEDTMPPFDPGVDSEPVTIIIPGPATLTITTP